MHFLINFAIFVLYLVFSNHISRIQMRYFIHFAYKGTPFHGWQKQNNAITVQEVLDEKLSIILTEKIETLGCGRTDTGVHAKQYYAHFDFNKAFPKNFLNRLNKLLPSEIAIYDIIDVEDVAHARFDATERTYKYFIHLNKDPFLDDRSWFIGNYKPDIELMNIAAKALLSFKDFSSLEKKGSDNTNSLCTLFTAKWEYTEQKTGMVFTISANRFLRNMVRRIVACLLEIGLGRMNQQIMINAMENKAYFEVGLTAPANGLHLWEIKYPYIVNC